MKCWTAVKLGIYIWAVLNDSGEAIELDEAGVRLLDMFNKVIGVTDDSIQVAVFSGYSRGLKGRGLYNLRVAMSYGSYTVTGEALAKMRGDGYYIPRSSSDFSLVDPGIALRFGVYACVSDKGRLLYLDSRSKERVVLGDFCTRLGPFCIQQTDDTAFVFDNRIVEVADMFHTGFWELSPIYINSRALTNSQVRVILDEGIKSFLLGEVAQP